MVTAESAVSRSGRGSPRHRATASGPWLVVHYLPVHAKSQRRESEALSQYPSAAFLSAAVSRGGFCCTRASCPASFTCLLCAALNSMSAWY